MLFSSFFCAHPIVCPFKDRKQIAFCRGVKFRNLLPKVRTHIHLRNIKVYNTP